MFKVGGMTYSMVQKHAKAQADGAMESNCENDKQYTTVHSIRASTPGIWSNANNPGLGRSYCPTQNHRGMLPQDFGVGDRQRGQACKAEDTGRASSRGRNDGMAFSDGLQPLRGWQNKQNRGRISKSAASGTVGIQHKLCGHITEHREGQAERTRGENQRRHMPNHTQ